MFLLLELLVVYWLNIWSIVSRFVVTVLTGVFLATTLAIAKLLLLFETIILNFINY